MPEETALVRAILLRAILSRNAVVLPPCNVVVDLCGAKHVHVAIAVHILGVHRVGVIERPGYRVLGPRCPVASGVFPPSLL